MNENKIELLINPFCLGDRDFSILSKKCEKYGLTLDVFNLWDIEDEDLEDTGETNAAAATEAGSALTNVRRFITCSF